MKLRHALHAACGLALLLSQSANAGLFYAFPFWQDNQPIIANEMQFGDDFLQLSVTAWTASYDDNHQQLLGWQQVTGNGLGVYQDDEGLGVVSVPGDGNDLDAGAEGDASRDPDEGLLLVFSRQVNIVDLFVGDLGPTDEVNFSVVDLTSPGQPGLQQSALDQTGEPGYRAFPLVFDAAFNGSAFMVWVNDDEDDIELLGVAVTAVPAPATALLLLTALPWLARQRRR